MKARIPLAIIVLSSIASAAFGATNISYTATADPNLNPDAMTAGGASANVWGLSYSGVGTSPQNYGSFLGNSANNGNGVSGAGAGASAWGLYASGVMPILGRTNEVRMDHTFMGGMLTLSQSVSIDFDAGFVDNGSQYGIRLNGPAGFVFALSFVGGDSAYRYFDNDAVNVPLGFGYNPDGFRLTYTQTGATTYTATVVQGATTLASVSGNVIGAPDFIQVYNANAGSGSNYDVFSNNLQIVPEPSAYFYVGVGGLGLMGLCLRRGRKASAHRPA